MIHLLALIFLFFPATQLLAYSVDCWDPESVVRLNDPGNIVRSCRDSADRFLLLGIIAEGQDDLVKSIGFFDKACKLGDKFSCWKKTHVTEGGDVEERLEEYQKRCLGTDEPGACAYLANHYMLLRNEAFGQKWSSEACNKNVAHACFRLVGGGPREANLAKSCNLGHSPACRALASAKGDSAGALQWLQNGCLQDDYDSCEDLFYRTENRPALVRWFQEQCHTPDGPICRLRLRLEARRGNLVNLQPVKDRCKKGALDSCETVAIVGQKISDAKLSAPPLVRLCLNGRQAFCMQAGEAMLKLGYVKEAASLLDRACNYAKDIQPQSSTYIVLGDSPSECSKAKLVRDSLSNAPPSQQSMLAEPRIRLNSPGKPFGRWRPINLDGAPEARANHSIIWTGDSVIVWGGQSDSERELNSGGRYHLKSNTWKKITEKNAPQRRNNHFAAWTGTQMIVWGGHIKGGQIYLNSGGLYDPSKDSWSPMSLIGAPTAGRNYDFVWCDKQLFVWNKGLMRGRKLFRFDPISNRWNSKDFDVPKTAPIINYAVITAPDAITFWGGLELTIPKDDFNADEIFSADGAEFLASNISNYKSKVMNSGMRYRPSTGAWEHLEAKGNAPPRMGSEAVMLNQEIFVWGGGNEIESVDVVLDEDETPIAVPSPFRVNLHNSTWLSLEKSGMPNWNFINGMIAAGSGLIFKESPSAPGKWLSPGRAAPKNLYGGMGLPSYWYDTKLNVWKTLAMEGAPNPRYYEASVWTGSELVVWGGVNSIDEKGQNSRGYHTVNSGGIWTP